MTGVYDEKQEIIFDYLGAIAHPFTLPELFKTTGLEKTKRSESELAEVLQVNDYFVCEKKTFFPRSSFLGNIPIRIQPTEFEIEKGIFIPGHRLLPFHPFGKPMDEIVFRYNGSLLKSETKHFKMADIQVFFSLMDLEKMPIINIEDILEEDAPLEIKTWDMRAFYKANDFNLGDTVIVRSLDFQSGLFSIRYDSLDNYRTHIFEIKQKDRKFIDSLKKVLEKKLLYPNVEKQLLYTYFSMKDETWDRPGTALGPLLSENPDIRFSILPNGRKIFHFAHEDVEDLNAYPDLTDYLDAGGDDEYEFETIDGILEYLNNNNNVVVVRALLLDQITAQNGFSYKKIEDYLFTGLEKPYLPPELQRHFQQLVNEEYRELKESFNPAYAFLPITTARKKVLDAALLISGFLRSLDSLRVRLEDLPKNDMMHLMELDRSLTDVLYNLEVSQLEEKNNGAEGHRILKMIDRLSHELPMVFDLIRSKIGS